MHGASAQVSAISLPIRKPPVGSPVNAHVFGLAYLHLVRHGEHGARRTLRVPDAGYVSVVKPIDSTCETDHEVIFCYV